MNGKCEKTPVDQTKFGKPEGNCLPACIATLIGIPLESIPIFGDGPGWYSKVEGFVRSQGFELIRLDNSGAHRFKPDGYHIGSGMSPRGLMHTCVFGHGKMVWDPHPSRAGIATVLSWYLYFPLEAKPWVAQLVGGNRCVCCKKQLMTPDECYPVAGCQNCFECSHRCFRGGAWPDTHSPWLPTETETAR